MTILIGDSGSDSVAILGQVFMRNFYVVFDQANMKFGFAPLIRSPKLKAAVVSGSTPRCSYETYYYSSCDASSSSSQITLTKE